MAEISYESHFFSGNIADMIPESSLNKMVPLTEDHDGGWGVCRGVGVVGVCGVCGLGVRVGWVWGWVGVGVGLGGVVAWWPPLAHGLYPQCPISISKVVLHHMGCAVPWLLL